MQAFSENSQWAERSDVVESSCRLYKILEISNTAKGQLFWKDFRYPRIPPKNKQKNSFFFAVLWLNCFVCFLEEFEDSKKSFWNFPLRTCVLNACSFRKEFTRIVSFYDLNSSCNWEGLIISPLTKKLLDSRQRKFFEWTKYGIFSFFCLVNVQVPE